jgi:uncharacterized damage-inducible protein DinB
MQDQLLETWNIHNRINLYLLDAVSPEALSAAPAKGRSAGEMFLHMHNVRLMWLQSAAPDLLEGLVKLEKEQAGDKDLLRQSLEASGQAIESLLRKSFASGGKIKGFKPHAAAFLGYLISHDSYHRGEIAVVLAQTGHKLDNKISFGMWEWGVR